MPIKICPNCQGRYVVGANVTDFVHDCSQNLDASNAVTQEDVVVMGTWEDFTGSGTKYKYPVMMQGAGNEVFGERGQLEEINKDEKTRRGHNATTTRQRKKLTFIQLNKEDK